MQQLHTLVGLSFTAMLADEGKIRSCRLSLIFLRYGNLIHPRKYEELAVAIAEITYSAFDSFKALGFPRYYDDFLLSMAHTASTSEIVSDETKNGIHEILLKLLD